MVDRAGLNKLPTDKLQETLKDLYAHNVIIVDNVRQFFSRKNLETSMNEGSDHLDLLFEYHKIDVSDADVIFMDKFYQIKKNIIDTLNAKNPVPSYPFCPVPDGWIFDEQIVVNKTTIRRKSVSNFSAGHKGLQTLWEQASKYWAKNSDFDDKQIRELAYRSLGGYNYNPIVYANRIKFGCQKIDRYELEQLAVHMGWTFP